MNLFPSTQFPPLTVDADPKAYVALGAKIQRGKPEFIMSRGELVRFAENPWKWLKSERNDATNEMQWGSAVDCMTLTPERFKDLYEVCPETYPTDKEGEKPWNWNATFCKNWRKEVEAAGKETIKTAELEMVRIAKFRLSEDPTIATILAHSQKQVQCIVEYHDKDTGLVVHIKTLLDLVPFAAGEWGKFLADLKTTADAAIQPWEKTIFYQGYHVQAALYTDAFNTVTGENRSGFLHIVQESDYPYAVARRMLSEEFMQLGRDTYRRALQHYCRCVAEGKFPGYDDANDNAANPIVDGFRVAQPAAWMIAA